MNTFKRSHFSYMTTIPVLGTHIQKIPLKYVHTFESVYNAGVNFLTFILTIYMNALNQLCHLKYVMLVGSCMGVKMF